MKVPAYLFLIVLTASIIAYASVNRYQFINRAGPDDLVLDRWTGKIVKWNDWYASR